MATFILETFLNYFTRAPHKFLSILRHLATCPFSPSTLSMWMELNIQYLCHEPETEWSDVRMMDGPDDSDKMDDITRTMVQHLCVDAVMDK